MAGRKTFTAGEVLQAADVNDFLMDQSVMVFAGSAARGSAIPSPSEGMVTYRSDDDVVEVFDGSAYKPVGGLVAVKHVLKTDTFSASVASGGNVAVTGLSITHEVADSSNKLIISAFFGQVANGANTPLTGIAVDDGSGLLAIGDAAGSRTRVSAGTRHVSGGEIGAMPSMMFVHTPGAGSKTYTVKAVNGTTGTNTVFINRTEDDPDSARVFRTVSSLVIQEVSV